MCFIYTMECHSAIKSNETMPFAETWMDLETIIQDEEKNRYCMSTHICGIYKSGTDEPTDKAEIKTQT